MVLDELGDTSSEQDRRKYFDQLDDDQSGAIDFEEYLEVWLISKHNIHG